MLYYCSAILTLPSNNWLRIDELKKEILDNDDQLPSFRPMDFYDQWNHFHREKELNQYFSLILYTCFYF